MNQNCKLTHKMKKVNTHTKHDCPIRSNPMDGRMDKTASEDARSRLIRWMDRWTKNWRGLTKMTACQRQKMSRKKKCRSRAEFHIGTQMKTLRRHEPSAIRTFSHFQISRRKMRRASCISTIWWGVTVSCSSSHLTCHFDLNLTGVGSRCRSDASFVLITDMSRLAVKMRRKYTCAVFESFRFPILHPLWKYKELLHMGGACRMFGESFIGRTKGRTRKKAEHKNWQNQI